MRFSGSGLTGVKKALDPRCNSNYRICHSRIVAFKIRHAAISSLSWDGAAR